VNHSNRKFLQETILSFLFIAWTIHVQGRIIFAVKRNVVRNIRNRGKKDARNARIETERAGGRGQRATGN